VTDPDLDFLRQFVEDVRQLREYQKVKDQTREDYDLAVCKRVEAEIDAKLNLIPRKM
jgi:hypothetical protein